MHTEHSVLHPLRELISQGLHMKQSRRNANPYSHAWNKLTSHVQNFKSDTAYAGSYNFI